MNDLVKADLREKIVHLLLCGDGADEVSRKLTCDLNDVLGVLGSVDYLERCTEILEKSIKSQALSSLRNIKEIANSTTASDATKLKANTYIVDKALDFNELGGLDSSPATMSQDGIARRIQELQAEEAKRAKPIDMGAIDADLSDMLD